jgi:hypothetical protein
MSAENIRAKLERLRTVPRLRICSDLRIRNGRQGIWYHDRELFFCLP